MGDKWMTSGRSRLKAMQKNGFAKRAKVMARKHAGVTLDPVQKPYSSQVYTHPSAIRRQNPFGLITSSRSRERDQHVVHQQHVLNGPPARSIPLHLRAQDTTGTAQLRRRIRNPHATPAMAMKRLQTEAPSFQPRPPPFAVGARTATSQPEVATPLLYGSEQRIIDPRMRSLVRAQGLDPHQRGMYHEDARSGIQAHYAPQPQFTGRDRNSTGYPLPQDTHSTADYHTMSAYDPHGEPLYAPAFQEGYLPPAQDTHSISSSVYCYDEPTDVFTPRPKDLALREKYARHSFENKWGISDAQSQVRTKHFSHEGQLRKQPYNNFQSTHPSYQMFDRHSSPPSQPQPQQMSSFFSNNNNNNSRSMSRPAVDYNHQFVPQQPHRDPMSMVSSPRVFHNRHMFQQGVNDADDLQVFSSPGPSHPYQESDYGRNNPSANGYNILDVQEEVQEPVAKKLPFFMSAKKGIPRFQRGRNQKSDFAEEELYDPGFSNTRIGHEEYTDDFMRDDNPELHFEHPVAPFFQDQARRHGRTRAIVSSPLQQAFGFDNGFQPPVDNPYKSKNSRPNPYSRFDEYPNTNSKVRKKNDEPTRGVSTEAFNEFWRKQQLIEAKLAPKKPAGISRFRKKAAEVDDKKPAAEYSRPILPPANAALQRNEGVDIPAQQYEDQDRPPVRHNNGNLMSVMHSVSAESSNDGKQGVAVSKSQPTLLLSPIQLNASAQQKANNLEHHNLKAPEEKHDERELASVARLKSSDKQSIKNTSNADAAVTRVKVQSKRTDYKSTQCDSDTALVQNRTAKTDEIRSNTDSNQHIPPLLKNDSIPSIQPPLRSNHCDDEMDQGSSIDRAIRLLLDHRREQAEVQSEEGHPVVRVPSATCPPNITVYKNNARVDLDGNPLSDSDSS